MIAMFATAEVRWFYRGDIPLSIADWFQAGWSLDEHVEQRTDRYLLLPDLETIGVKIRGEVIEVKIRHPESHEVHFAEGVQGCLERWSKWSYRISPRENVGVDRWNLVGEWLNIRKERWLRRYAVRQNGQVHPLDVGVDALSGCDLELSAIEADEKRWWSLALESYGVAFALEPNVVQVAQVVFGRGTPERLSLSLSFGYPQWLSQLESVRRGA